MDRRFLTVLGVSLLFALVISSVFYQMTARAGSPKKAEATDLKDIVLAARPLSVGTTVKPADIKLGKIPSAAFPKGAFAKPEEVIDRPLISNILMDEPVLEGRLAARGSGVGLAPIIPVGMRAVTLRVNDVTGIAGFVLPGMRVDVLVTGHPPNSDSLGHRHTGAIAKSAGAFGRNRDAAGCARSGHAGPDRHLARDAGASRDAHSGQRRCTHSIGLEKRQRSDHRENARARHRGIVRRTRGAQEDRGKHRCTPAASPARGGGRSPASASSAARSDRGDSRNAEERGSGWSRWRGKVNHATNQTAVHPVWC